jgi:hypothetical protein
MNTKQLSGAELAKVIMLAQGLAIIEAEASSGKFSCNGGRFASTREWLMKLYEWIIGQAGDFTNPVTIKFHGGDGAVVGYCLTRIIDPVLANSFFKIRESGLSIPSISCGWENGPQNPFIMISDLDSKRGILGFNHDGVRTINVYSDPPESQRTAMFKEIMGDALPTQA